MATRHENRNAGGLCNAIVRPVLDVGEEDDLALNRRQSRERREESSAEVCALERADRLGRLARQGLVDRHEAAPTNRAESVQGLAMDDGEQPGGKAGRVSAGGKLVVGVHEGLLRDVVGLGGVAEDGERARECGASVASHKRRERVVISRECAEYQLFVGQLGGHAICRTPDSGSV